MKIFSFKGMIVKLVLIAAFVFGNIPALAQLQTAKTQSVWIVDADDFMHAAIIDVSPMYDRWFIEVEHTCWLEWYEYSFVYGSWLFDPSSHDAKLLLPNGSTCRIWSAQRL